MAAGPMTACFYIGMGTVKRLQNHDNKKARRGAGRVFIFLMP